ncbi:TldD/PmbA family protein [Candidatus Woesearchaeota archaeon]|nr:TldD/PmbA family protein [Candidatus Woesearchaeota archaeon]
MGVDRVFDILEKGLDDVHSAKCVTEIPLYGEIKQKPYYTSLQAKRTIEFDIAGGNGGVVVKDITPTPVVNGRLILRMGDFERGGGRKSIGFPLPTDIEENASLRYIHTSGNQVFWHSAEDLQGRIKKTVGRSKQKEKFLYFSKEQPVTHTQIPRDINLDFEDLEQRLKNVTGELMNGSLLTAAFDFKTYLEESFFVDSEGSKIYTDYMRYVLVLDLDKVDSDHLIIPYRTRFTGTDLKTIPSEEELMVAGENAARNLSEIVNAPFEKNGIYHVVLSGKIHGVLWHEVAGHLLEGHRMQEDEYGDVASTFKDQLGQVVAPVFLSVYDDPTKEESDAHFLFDEEGVPGQKVTLIKNGVLIDYLHCRESAGYFETNSNGHARADKTLNPVARMSNLIVESSDNKSFEELKEELRKNCRDNNKEYGLMFIGSEGGFVIPSENIYNVSPQNVFRIYSDGREERVRGVHIVGTPHQAINSIVSTTNNYEVSNGFCGAESGLIPSTQMAPDALAFLEVNAIPKSEYSELGEPVMPFNFK